jgi:serine/threonine-protein kinase
MSESLHLQLQAALGDGYRVDRELGGGGMSRVFLADETRLGRRVVIKVLTPELTAGVSAERFEREVLLAAALQEPHIVPVLTAGDADGMPYYTMPFVDGLSLRQRMQQGPVPLDLAISVLRDVIAALAYAHARRIVHRDIKPENVLLSGNTAVVTDFGIVPRDSATRETSRRQPRTSPQPGRRSVLPRTWRRNKRPATQSMAALTCTRGASWRTSSSLPSIHSPNMHLRRR